MNYSVNDILNYVKANWKHILAGFVTYAAAQHFGVPGSTKAAAILKIFGLAG